MFTKNTCKVMKGDGGSVLCGSKSSDKCYLLESDFTYHVSNTDCIDL